MPNATPCPKLFIVKHHLPHVPIVKHDTASLAPPAIAPVHLTAPHAPTAILTVTTVAN